MYGLTSTTLRVCTAITAFCLIPLTISVVWSIAERCCLHQPPSLSTPAVIRHGTQRLWKAKLSVCVSATIMGWFSLSTYLVGSRKYECFILGTIVPMVYVFTKFMMYIFLWYKNRLVRPMSPVSRFEKVLLVATLGVIPFMGIVGAFIHGVVLDDVCFVEPPGELSATMLAIDFVLSLGYVLLFTKALRESLDRARTVFPSSLPDNTGTSTAAASLPPPSSVVAQVSSMPQTQTAATLTIATMGATTTTTITGTSTLTSSSSIHMPPTPVAAIIGGAFPPHAPSVAHILVAPAGAVASDLSPATISHHAAPLNLSSHSVQIGPLANALGGTPAPPPATTATGNNDGTRGSSNAVAADELAAVIKRNFRACVLAILSTVIVMSWVTFADWALQSNYRTLKLITCTAGCVDLTFDVLIVMHASHHRSERSPSSSRHSHNKYVPSVNKSDRVSGDHRDHQRSSATPDRGDRVRDLIALNQQIGARSSTGSMASPQTVTGPRTAGQHQPLFKMSSSSPTAYRSQPHTPLAAAAHTTLGGTTNVAAAGTFDGTTTTNRTPKALPFGASSSFVPTSEAAAAAVAALASATASPIQALSLPLPSLASPSPLPSPGSPPSSYHHLQYMASSSGGGLPNSGGLTIRPTSSRLPLPSSRTAATPAPHTGGRTHRSARGHDQHVGSPLGTVPQRTPPMPTTSISAHPHSPNPSIGGSSNNMGALRSHLSSRPAASYDPDSDTPMDEDEARVEADSPLHVRSPIVPMLPFLDPAAFTQNRRGSIVAARSETPLPRVNAQLILTSPVSASRTFLNPAPLCRSPSFPPGSGRSGGPTSGRKSARNQAPHHRAPSLTMSPRQLPPALQ